MVQHIGYFPILYSNEKAIDTQIRVGVDMYRKYLGRNPKGIWLPECGYIPESDKYLKKYGIEYIITETHGILYADPTPVYGTFAPIISHGGVIAFGRDLESSRQVWSNITGYPGAPNFRDFYKDIGYEAPYEYILPYIAKNGVRVHTGIKYHSITGKTPDKNIYDIDKARQIVEMQADHFMHSRETQLMDVQNGMINKPIVLCPYDSELYGHWWYEGPHFIYSLFKKIYYDTNIFKCITPSEYIAKYPNIQISTPCRSSWGANRIF